MRKKGFSATAVLGLAALLLCPLAVSRDKSQSEDIVWTLRSSRSTQPVLRIADTAPQGEPVKLPGSPDYTGYFQLYSKSVETSSGTSEGVGSQFSVTMPLDP